MQAIKRVSERAIAWLYTQALPPSPQNYWLAFACLDGQHAELSRTLDALLDGGVRLKQVEASAARRRRSRSSRTTRRARTRCGTRRCGSPTWPRPPRR
jgi:hypothetical protein